MMPCYACIFIKCPVGTGGLWLNTNSYKSNKIPAERRVEDYSAVIWPQSCSSFKRIIQFTLSFPQGLLQISPPCVVDWMKGFCRSSVHPLLPSLKHECDLEGGDGAKVGGARLMRLLGAGTFLIIIPSFFSGLFYSLGSSFFFPLPIFFFYLLQTSRQTFSINFFHSLPHNCRNQFGLWQCNLIRTGVPHFSFPCRVLQFVRYFCHTKYFSSSIK